MSKYGIFKYFITGHWPFLMICQIWVKITFQRCLVCKYAEESTYILGVRWKFCMSTSYRMNQLGLKLYLFHSMSKYGIITSFITGNRPFLRTCQIWVTRPPDPNLHSGGPKSIKSNFKGHKVIFRDSYFFHLFPLGSKCWTQKITFQPCSVCK